MTTAISRQLSICTFADEKTTTPKRSGLSCEVVELTPSTVLARASQAHARGLRAHWHARR